MVGSSLVSKWPSYLNSHHVTLKRMLLIGAVVPFVTATEESNEVIGVGRRMDGATGSCEPPHGCW